MAMKLRQLEMLRAVMESGSVTEAAERLRVSQPAVSKTVQLAEAELGFPLFLRERGRLLPTTEARTLLPEIIRATAAMEAVQRLAEDLQGLRTGLVTLAAAPTLGNSLVAEAIARFRAERPGVRVILEMLLNHEVVEAVADHRVDLGMVLLPADDSSTMSRDICAADLVCVMPEGHELAALPALGPAELASHPLISFNRHQPIGTLIDDAFRAASLRRTIAVEISQSWTGCSLALAGAGIAVIDGFAMLGITPPGLVVRPFHPRMRITGRLLSDRNRPISRLATAFAATLQGVVAAKVAQGRIFAPAA
jgi:DNA-binding transcriptional LysR family regulator